MAVMLNARRWTIRRFELGESEGVFQEKEITPFTIRASLQPMDPSEVENFPEGFRATAAWLLVTDPSVELSTVVSSLRDDRGLAADRLVYSDGTLLYVHDLTDWRHGLLPAKYWVLLEPETEVGREVEF